MTCIVGLIDNGVTYIGGDSCGSNGYSGDNYKQPKVFHCKDTNNAVMGYTSSFRMGQLLMYAKNLFDELSISKDVISHEYLVTKFIPNIQNLFSTGGFEENNSGVKSSGVFLLGYKHKLYKIQGDYSVLESMNNYDACGCGQDYALGSLKTTENMNLSPIDRIHIALQSASKFSTGVSAPFYIVNTANNDVFEFKE